MLGFVARRVARLALTVLVSTVVVFAAVSLVPGDELTALSGGRTLTPEATAALRAEHHLDDPAPLRYARWVGDAARGDLGRSVVQRDEVGTIVGQRLPITLQLVALAGLLVAVGGVGLGLLAGLRRGVVDRVVTAMTAVMAAVPPFVAALVLLTVFAVSLRWVPALGPGDGGFDRLHHLIAPALALAISASAIVARVTRVAVREELGREHVQTAVSRGLPRSAVIRRHVLRNAALPVVTVTGVTVASLFALAAVVEVAFGLNGVGATLVSAAGTGDVVLVQGIALVLLVAFVAVNTLVDVAVAALDPRVAARRVPA